MYVCVYVKIYYLVRIEKYVRTNPINLQYEKYAVDVLFYTVVQFRNISDLLIQNYIAN